jgi:hypothetical protein
MGRTECSDLRRLRREPWLDRHIFNESENGALLRVHVEVCSFRLARKSLPAGESGGIQPGNR